MYSILIAHHNKAQACFYTFSEIFLRLSCTTTAGTETEENLRAAFEEFGEIDNLRVPGKNFGFVQFKHHISVRLIANVCMRVHLHVHACECDEILCWSLKISFEMISILR
jgi:hypothetical protein